MPDGMASAMPYILGALGGGGALCVWYGLKRVRDAEAGSGAKRLGLVLVNVGVLLIAGTLYLLATR